MTEFPQVKHTYHLPRAASSSKIKARSSRPRHPKPLAQNHPLCNDKDYAHKPLVLRLESRSNHGSHFDPVQETQCVYGVLRDKSRHQPV